MPSRLVVVTQLTRRAPGSGSDETVSLARELVGLLAELRRPGRHLALIEIGFVLKKTTTESIQSKPRTLLRL